MEQIKILFFSLLSFFGVEDSRLAANKTTVTIDPVNKSIEINQENLFAFIQQESDNDFVIDQWNRLIDAHKSKNWSNELSSLTNKSLRLDSIDEKIQPQITFTYLNEKDLRPMGIWYDETTKLFSINNVPSQNIETTDGKLVGNYWKFDGTRIVSFSLQPFKSLPENYLKLKQPIETVIKK